MDPPVPPPFRPYRCTPSTCRARHSCCEDMMYSTCEPGGVCKAVSVLRGASSPGPCCCLMYMQYLSVLLNEESTPTLRIPVFPHGSCVPAPRAVPAPRETPRLPAGHRGYTHGNLKSACKSNCARLITHQNGRTPACISLGICPGYMPGFLHRTR